jgi:uncharacterized protein (DUF849 family)
MGAVAMILQACLNGARSPDFHPRLPTSQDSIVAEAVASVAAGAQELHIHPRDSQGRESLAPQVVDPLMAALRDRLPGTAIGLSTGAWIERNEDRRLICLGGWRVLPDYVSVNLSEAGAPGVVEKMFRLGVGVEAGLASVADAERLLALDLRRLALRVLIEIEEQETEKALATADAVRAVLARGGIGKPILLHGADATVWPLARHALAHRLSIRLGLEDGRDLPDGRPAADNAELIRAGADLMS